MIYNFVWNEIVLNIFLGIIGLIILFFLYMFYVVINCLKNIEKIEYCIVSINVNVVLMKVIW